MPFPPFRFVVKNVRVGLKPAPTLKILDQRRLPGREIWLDCAGSRKVYAAIRDMAVRGAPAIGIVGGYGLYLGIRNFRGPARAAFFKELHRQADFLKSARPTGVNLRNIIDSIVEKVGNLPEKNVERLKKKVLEEARRAHQEDDRLCRKIGRFGQALFRSGDRVLTHCNAGGLATSGYGTALGVLYAAKEKGKKLTVFADETRPLLQGARLTAWELKRSKIPCTILCDNTAASLMREGKIDRVVVGADRIAANGDTANKIGTYNVALLAKAHGIPFYIAAPKTTFDFSIRTGKKIPIERRDEREITQGFGKRTAPVGVPALNLAFDVTPHELITAFITDAGVLRPPFGRSFRKLRKETSNK